MMSNHSSPSLLPSNYDLLSRDSKPASSYSQTTSLSFEDSIEFISDQEELPPSNHGVHSPISLDQHQQNQATQIPSSELLTALTRHLVMPRLPILSNTPSNQSIPSRNLSHQSSNLVDLSSKKLSSSSTPKFLIVGDSQSAYGLGTLDSHLSPYHLDRATEIAPQFNLSDPSTHASLIQQIESPFVRLKQILNPKFFYSHRPSCLPTPIRDDLINVMNSWVEREGYLLLMIEVKSFPLSAENLEFILTLSRLIPTIPFIPSQIPLKKAIDGHAIVTRQLISKRIRHFAIPKPNHYKSFMFPNREECLVRSSKCYLDWLTVEFATSNLNIDNYLQEQELIIRRGRESEDDYLELDRWSEQVSIQMKRRNAHQLHSGRSEYGKCTSRTDGKIVEQLVKLQGNDTIDDGDDDNDERKREINIQTWISMESFGLPSMTGLIKIGLSQLRKEVGFFLSKFYECIVLNCNNDNSSGHKIKKFNSKNRGNKPVNQSISSDSFQSDNNENLKDDYFNFTSSHVPFHSSASPTTSWFIIGFFTATTAASISIWYKDKIFFV